MNIEHRTSNVQHRIMYSVNLNKDGASLLRRTKGLRRPGVSLPFEILWFSILLFSRFKIDKAQRHQYSTFDVGRSMFDVQSKPGTEAVNLIKMDTLIYGVSYKRRRWPRASSLIGKETMPFWRSFTREVLGSGSAPSLTSFL